MKKKILYIGDYDPHIPYSGIGIRGTQFVNYLSQYYEIDLIYMEGCGHPANAEVENKFVDKIQNVNQKIRIPFSQIGYFLYSTSMHRAAENLLRANRYDYILVDYGLSARYGYKLSKQFDIPFIYNSGNVEFRQYWGKVKTDIRRLPLVPYVYWVERKGCKSAKILVAVSDNDAKFFTKWTSNEKMIVVPQGFDETVFNPFYEPPKNDPKIILFCGNYNISTNREAVKATYECIADQVVRQMPNVKFQFVGTNPPVSLAHSNFEFTGFVENLPPYIKQADVVISPMLKGWGMPTKVVEALACGKRVIATEIGARSVPSYYKRLTLCDIASFPNAIINALQENHPVDQTDFEALKKDFSWTYRLNKLREKIDKTLNGE